MFNFTLFLPNISIEMPNVYLQDIMINVNVFDIVDVKGSYSYNAASDHDCAGYSELGFRIMFGEGEVYDSDKNKGYVTVMADDGFEINLYSDTCAKEFEIIEE